MVAHRVFDLKDKIDGIWSDDKDFDRQNKVKVWKTGGVLIEFNKS
ncbi:MAG: hypothetical protein AABW80_01050 [Nanoarchaeota archaeon]